MNVLWLGLVKGRPLSSVQERLVLAEDAFKIEKILGIIGGKQDQCASAVGGINVFKFSKEGIRAIPVGLSVQRVRELELRLLLCYTGVARLSSRIHENVWGNFAKGHREIIDALIRMRDSAYEGKEALEEGNFENFGKILSLQFECTKIMDSSTSNQMLEDLFSLVKGDIVGDKPCGAGGGAGCVVFCCDGEEARKRASEKIAKAGFTILDCSTTSRWVSRSRAPSNSFGKASTPPSSAAGSCTAGSSPTRCSDRKPSTRNGMSLKRRLTRSLEEPRRFGTSSPFRRNWTVTLSVN